MVDTSDGDTRRFSSVVKNNVKVSFSLLDKDRSEVISIKVKNKSYKYHSSTLWNNDLNNHFFHLNVERFILKRNTISSMTKLT